MTAFRIKLQDLQDQTDLQTISDEELDRLRGGLGWDNVAGAAAGGGGYVLGTSASNLSNGKPWNDGLNAKDFSTNALAGAINPAGSLASFGLSAASSFVSNFGVENIGKQGLQYGTNLIMEAGRSLP